MPHAYFFPRICSEHSLISKMCAILAERFKARAVRNEGCKHDFMVHYPSLSNSATLSLVRCNASVTALPDQNTADVLPAHSWASFFLHEFHSEKSNELRFFTFSAGKRPVADGLALVARRSPVELDLTTVEDGGRSMKSPWQCALTEPCFRLLRPEGGAGFAAIDLRPTSPRSNSMADGAWSCVCDLDPFKPGLPADFEGSKPSHAALLLPPQVAGGAGFKLPADGALGLVTSKSESWQSRL